MNELLLNIDKLHTTDMGAERIKRNLSVKTNDVVQWCREKILNEETRIERKGKNWYCQIDNMTITVNSHSYTIITAHLLPAGKTHKSYCTGKSIMTEDIWDKLYKEARRVQNNRVISPFIEAGGVATAILTRAGNIYVGVCIDTASTLGMCAERNAIANMITNGEHQIDKVIAVLEDGCVGSPCGACREYMMQLDKDSGEIEILLDYEKRETVRLKELIPDWWGKARFNNAWNTKENG